LKELREAVEAKPVLEGAGLEGPLVDEPAVFTAKAQDQDGKTISTDDNKYQVVIKDPNNNEIEAVVKGIGDGIFEIEYNPTKPGLHHISVTWNDKHTKELTVDVKDSRT